MKPTLLAAIASLCLLPSAFTAPQAEVMTPIRQFIDGVNTGDTKSAFAAYSGADILIIDEFAPRRQTGPKAAQEWAAAYDQHAQTTAAAAGSVKYGKPTRVEIEGEVACVIVPTVYN